MYCTILLLLKLQIIVHSSTVAAILCPLPTTSNPKSVGGMYCAVLDGIGLNPIMVQIINIHQPWPGLPQTPLGKHQSEMANYGPGKPDMLSQHAKETADKLSQHAECRQAIPTCTAKVMVYKGAPSAQNSRQAERAK